MGHRPHKLLDRRVKRLADAQEREDSDGAAGLDHLPMADAEAVGNHILLAQFARGTVTADFVTEPPKKTGVMSREFSACPHILKAGGIRSKTPRAKRRVE